MSTKPSDAYPWVGFQSGNPPPPPFGRFSGFGDALQLWEGGSHVMIGPFLPDLVIRAATPFPISSPPGFPSADCVPTAVLVLLDYAVDWVIRAQGEESLYLS